MRPNTTWKTISAHDEAFERTPEVDEEGISYITWKSAVSTNSRPRTRSENRWKRLFGLVWACENPIEISQPRGDRAVYARSEGTGICLLNWTPRGKTIWNFRVGREKSHDFSLMVASTISEGQMPVHDKAGQDSTVSARQSPASRQTNIHRLYTAASAASTTSSNQ